MTDVTLDLEVQLVVQMTIDLSRLTVLAEETTENAHAANPDDLLWETSLAGTMTLTSTSVTTLRLGIVTLVNASAGMDGSRLADDITISDQLTKVLT